MKFKLCLCIHVLSSIAEVRTNGVLSAGTYEVIAEVVDHCDSTGTATLTVTVTDTVRDSFHVSN